MTRRRPARLVLLGLALLGLAGGVGLAADEKPAAGPPPPAGAPDFDHARHADKAGAKIDMQKCATCHTVKADGANTPPGGNGHQPCMSSGCHVKAFLDKNTKLCLVCHTTTDRHKKNPAHLFAGKTEHYVEFSHDAHMKRKVAGGDQPIVCQTCHTVDAAFRAVRRPGHAQCAPCHGKLDSAPMAECDGCHLRGDATTHFDKKRKDAELKKGAFIHERVEHRFFDPGQEQKPIQCDTCHYRVEKFTSLRDLKGAPLIDTVTMNNNCARCHDVKDTGKCTVCHIKGTVISTFNYHGL